MSLPGHLTSIKAGGTPTTFSNEATTKVTANTVYQITDTTKRILDPDTAVTAEVDADGAGGGGYVAAAASTFVVDYMFGTITFAADQGASALVRVSGKYIPTHTIGGGVDFELEDSANLLDDTRYGNTFRRRMTGLQEVTGSMTLIDSINLDLDAGAGTVKLGDTKRAGTKVLLEFRPGGGTDYWRGWVYLSQVSQKAPADSRFEGTVQFSNHAADGAGQSELAVPTWGNG